jgi:hypothetical protein
MRIISSYHMDQMKDQITMDQIFRFLGILSLIHSLIQGIRYPIINMKIRHIVNQITDHLNEWNCTYDPVSVMPIDHLTIAQIQGPGQLVKTLDLRLRLEKLRQNKKLRLSDYQGLIDLIPVSSNYWITNLRLRDTVIGSIYKIVDHHHISTTSIKKHIELYDLTESCEIMLSRDQANKLWELEHWDIYR